MGLYTLRHSAASVMLTHGVPITVVSQLLGHSGIAFTVDVYGHLSPEISRDALTVLAAALNGAPSGTSATPTRTPGPAPDDTPDDSGGATWTATDSSAIEGPATGRSTEPEA